MRSRAPEHSHRRAAGLHGAPRYGTRSPPTRTVQDRLLHRSESARKDEALDAWVPSSHRTKQDEPCKVGPLLQAPSERACHAPVPCRGPPNRCRKAALRAEFRVAVGYHERSDGEPVEAVEPTYRAPLIASEDYK